jgi:hypothetical protein
MSLIETGLQLFDSFFSHFLTVRLEQGWNAEIMKIGEWLASE